MQSINQIRFGVNYTPTRNWYYCWNDFEAGSIAGDLDTIQELEADHIRLFTLWPSFQPNPTWVSPLHLRHLETVLDLAAERDLDVCVTALNGWASGGSMFIPSWIRKKPFYSDPDIWNGVEYYFRELSKVCKDRSNFMGFDIGNEINCCWQPASLAEGDAWFLKTMDLLESLCPDKVHVNGVDHDPFFNSIGFSPEVLAKRQSIVTLHTWIFFTGALDRGGPFDPPSINLTSAMTAMAKTWAGDINKPIWIEEYGASEEWVDPVDIPGFSEKLVRNAWKAGANWYTWWCSHDVDRKFDFDELEYSLGLITLDQKIKPQGLLFRELAREFRREGPCKQPLGLFEDLPRKNRTKDSTWEYMLDWIRKYGE